MGTRPYCDRGSNEPVLPTLEEHAWVLGHIAISGSNEPVLPTLEEHAWVLYWPYCDQWL